MSAVMNSCCCSRKGALAATILTIIIGVSTSLLPLLTKSPVFSGWSSMVLSALCVIVSAIAVFGINKGKWQLLVPYIIFSVVAACASAALLFYKLLQFSGTWGIFKIFVIIPLVQHAILFIVLLWGLLSVTKLARQLRGKSGIVTYKLPY